ncbi:MAG: zinc-ribbon domain-containing protein [Eubacteriaceae bacterium]|nr:zinc-ribbon domain-containing protein [Eubacteriaceae bacterium]
MSTRNEQFCGNCGKKALSSNKYCVYCGKPYQQRQPAPPRKLTRCPNCRTNRVFSAKFCHSCGFDYEAEEASRVETAKTGNQALLPFCRNCGKELATNAVFCPACGTKTPHPQNAPRYRTSEPPDMGMPVPRARPISPSPQQQYMPPSYPQPVVPPAAPQLALTCSYCGKPLRAGAKFCVVCGASSEKLDVQEASRMFSEYPASPAEGSADPITLVLADRTCLNCGNPITNSNARFCTKCGTTLEEGDHTSYDGAFAPLAHFDGLEDEVDMAISEIARNYPITEPVDHTHTQNGNGPGAADMPASQQSPDDVEGNDMWLNGEMDLADEIVLELPDDGGSVQASIESQYMAEPTGAQEPYPDGAIGLPDIEIQQTTEDEVQSSAQQSQIQEERDDLGDLLDKIIDGDSEGGE